MSTQEYISQNRPGTAGDSNLWESPTLVTSEDNAAEEASIEATSTVATDNAASLAALAGADLADNAATGATPALPSDVLTPAASQSSGGWMMWITLGGFAISLYWLWTQRKRFGF